MAAWSYGVNNYFNEIPAAQAKECKLTGNFRKDFDTFSQAVGVTAHPALSPHRRPAVTVPANSEEESPSEDHLESTLSLQSILFDRAAFDVLRYVLPVALHVQTLRFTGCFLDTEQLPLLRLGLGSNDGPCTVTTLHIDWNRLRLIAPSEKSKAIATDAAMDQDQKLQAIDEQERIIDATECKRDLQTLAALLSALQGLDEDLNSMLTKVALTATPGHGPTSMLEPLALDIWVDALCSLSKLLRPHAERVFQHLDTQEYGPGDGLVPLSCLEAALRPPGSSEQDGEKAPSPPPDDTAVVSEACSALGGAFASFIDGTSPLEIASFRSCDIDSSLLSPISKALACSPHLRALNLWGNLICDSGAAILAEAFETNNGLQCLSLGRNLITHIGLEHLCRPFGISRLEDKDKADRLTKQLKDTAKEIEKLKKKPEAPKTDGSGRERYTPEPKLDAIEPMVDTSGSYWLWQRNLTLKTLNVEQNPISDAYAVMRLKPFGAGSLVLRGCPCVPQLKESTIEASAAPEQAVAEQERATTKPGSQQSDRRTPSKIALLGWTLHLE